MECSVPAERQKEKLTGRMNIEDREGIVKAFAGDKYIHSGIDQVSIRPVLETWRHSSRAESTSELLTRNGYPGFHSLIKSGAVPVEQIFLAGVYVLWLDGECVYVGQSQTVPQRLVQHRKGWGGKGKHKPKRFDAVTVIPLKDAGTGNLNFRLLRLEEQYISLLKPKLNI